MLFTVDLHMDCGGNKFTTEEKVVEARNANEAKKTAEEYSRWLHSHSDDERQRIYAKGKCEIIRVEPTWQSQIRLWVQHGYIKPEDVFAVLMKAYEEQVNRRHR